MNNKTLSADSLRQAAESMASYDSFARALVEHVLRTASDQIEKGERLSSARDLVSFDVPVTVRLDQDGCYTTCVLGKMGYLLDSGSPKL